MISQSSAYTFTFYLQLTADASFATGLTPTITISKAGGIFAAAAGTVTEISSGWYKVAFTAVDTNTAGDLSIIVLATGCDSVYAREQVRPDLESANVELTAIPTGVATVRQQVQYIFQYFRNKRTITSSTETMYKEDSSTVLGTAGVSDDGTTATKAKGA